MLKLSTPITSSDPPLVVKLRTPRRSQPAQWQEAVYFQGKDESLDYDGAA
jgi:hypothetical protein